MLHGDVAEIGFASSTGRLYSVHLRTNLLDAAGWNSVILDRQGSNGVTTLMHTNTAPVKLYRLNARRP